MKQNSILTIPIILSLLCLFVAGAAIAEDSVISLGQGQVCDLGLDGGGSTATGNHSYNSSWNLTYATTNPTTINSGESVTIKVKNGQQNFNWSVTGSVVFFQETGNTFAPGEDVRELVVQAMDDVYCKEQVTITVEDNSNPTQTVQGTLTVLPIETLEWDYDNSDQTIAANGSCTVTVVEQDGGPYVWQIMDGSAYFDSAYTQSNIQTTGNSVTLYTNNACGAIEIYVEDACGLNTTGYVRSTSGTWDYLVTDYQGAMSDYTEAYFTPQKYSGSSNCQSVYRSETVGKYRVVYDWTNNYSTNKVYSVYTRSGEFITTITGVYSNHDICRIQAYEWKCN